MLSNLQIPRRVLLSIVQSLQLHLFTDASEKACAAAVFVRSISGEQVCSYLLVTKTRVAPVKTVSFPRLELCGAHLGIKLLSAELKALQSTKWNAIEVPGWTESTIVLQWLRAIARTWTTFVTNRVSEIQAKLPRAKWKPVRYRDNPADLDSRGIDVEELIKSQLWWNGPTFLQQREDSWPFQLLVVPYTQKAIEKMRQSPTPGHKTANDFTQAKYLVVQQIQIQHLQEEYQLLRDKKHLLKTS